ncbi:MAG: winged helix-turn-helix domain-containing protein [Bacilli bacterium]
MVQDFITGPLDHQTISRWGKIIRLTDIEYRILALLVENLGQPVSPEIIIQHIWSDGRTGHKENLKVQIRKIRRRIENDPSTPEHLLSVRGKGYMLL